MQQCVAEPAYVRIELVVYQHADYDKHEYRYDYRLSRYELGTLELHLTRALEGILIGSNKLFLCRKLGVQPFVFVLQFFKLIL